MKKQKKYKTKQKPEQEIMQNCVYEILNASSLSCVSYLMLAVASMCVFS